jgi:hypothetical protein
MGGPAATALAQAKLRLVNASPEAQELQLQVGGTDVGGPAAFGQVTPYAPVGSGAVQLELKDQQATAQEQLRENARYTAVAIPKGKDGIELKIYKDGAAKPGDSRLRVVHAAPELGSPDIRLGKRTIAEAVAFKEATPYLVVSPGSYTFAVVRPGGSEAVFDKRVALPAGSTTTAILAGSGGAPGRVILASDQSVTPAGAPETGLGGLAEGGRAPWLLVALAALLAGAAGGIAQLSLVRRSGRR